MTRDEPIDFLVLVDGWSGLRGEQLLGVWHCDYLRGVADSLKCPTTI